MNVQMNVRIDEQIKHAGDEVFSSMGLTPTQVVRAVWEYAATHRDAPAAVRKVLGLPADETDGILRSIAHESSICERLREQFGLATPGRLEDIDYRNLHEQAMREHAAERRLA